MSEFFEVSSGAYSLMLTTTEYSNEESFLPNDTVFSKPSLSFLSFESYDFAINAKNSIERNKIKGLTVTPLFALS